MNKTTPKTEARERERHAASARRSDLPDGRDPATSAGALNALLADTFALYVKTKNFHWHMSGPHFRDYHLLLDEQADQIYAITDPIAERVRKLGGNDDQSIGHIARLARVADNDAEYVEPLDMLARIARRQPDAGGADARDARPLRRAPRRCHREPARSLDRRGRAAHLVPLRGEPRAARRADTEPRNGGRNGGSFDHGARTPSRGSTSLAN